MSFDSFLAKKNESPDMSLLMGEAIKAAERAKARGDIPIGAVLSWSKSYLAEHDTSVSEGNPLQTAGMNVLNKAFDMLPHRVSSCVLYSTVEPDALSVLAAYKSGVNEVVFGAFDLKNGFTSSKSRTLDLDVYDVKYKGGILAKECFDLLPDEMKGYCSAE